LQMSLIPPHEKEDILLPSNMKVIKDLCISPSNGSHALFASIGKLSVLRCDPIYIDYCLGFLLSLIFYLVELVVPFATVWKATISSFPMIYR